MECKYFIKKRNRAPPFIAHLPICNESTDTIYQGEFEWPVFTGKFTGTAVVVDDQKDAIALSRKGYFGKGSLSRGAPAFCKRKTPTRVISESQWKRRKLWSVQAFKEFQSAVPDEISEQEKPDSNAQEKKDEKDKSKNLVSSSKDNEEKSAPVELSEGMSVEVNSSTTNPPNLSEAMSVGVNSLSAEAPNLSEAMSVEVNSLSAEAPSLSEAMSVGVKSCLSEAPNLSETMSLGVNSCLSEGMSVELNSLSAEAPMSAEAPSLSEAMSVGVKSCLSEAPNLSEGMSVELNTSSAVAPNLSEGMSVELNSSSAVAPNLSEGMSVELNSSSAENELSEEKAVKTNTSFTEAPKLEDDEVLVISDLGLNLDEAIANLKPHIEKESPRTVIEVLYLTLEEAFFLSYALDCLQVLDLTGKYLSSFDLWAIFREAQPDFVEKYVAYHHFRAQGWVVKPGLKYGGDFLLYKKGPLYYHASLIVLVKPIKHDGSSPSSSRKDFTWDKITTLNRMAESAIKEIVICEVMLPDVPEKSLENPEILKEFKVGELLLRRFTPTEEKEVDE